MLKEIYISNLAVIREATIPLTANLNIFTGETGAGKSILINGINAVLGQRCSKDIVRSGCEKAVITALFTELSPEIREKARAMLGENMAARVENGEGGLYAGIEDALLSLKASGHTLIFLSNCRIHYMERHRRVFRLDRFFDSFFCCEEYGFIPKYEIFRRFSDRFEGDFIVVGDRFHDIDTAVRNGLHSIGCGYGYGSEDELRRADIIVTSPAQIPDAVNALARKGC